MKNLLTVLLTFIFPGVMQLHAQPGLIGCYPLSNTPNDFSGNNYHGTAYNLTPANDRFGNPNQAYHFSGNNSTVLIDNAPFILNNYTYSVWFKLDSLPSTGNYFSILANGGNIADQSILIGNNNGIGHLGIGSGSWDSLPSPHACYEGILPNLNQWYHVTVTRDNDSLKLYLGNNLICTQSTGSNAGYMGNPNNASIGSRIDSTSQNFIGDIDDLMIFNTALSHSEITQLDTSCFNITGIHLPAFPMSPVCYLDQESGQIIFTGDPSSITPETNVNVFNIYGQLIFYSDKYVKSVNAAEFSKGMYLVVTKNNFSQKVVTKIMIY